MKKAKLGSGVRFKNVATSVAKEYEKKGKSPAVAKKIGAAVAANAGRSKWGITKMTKMAVKGKKMV